MQSTENSKKVVVIGDGVVGKTSLVAKITEGKFITNYHMTVGGKKLSFILAGLSSRGVLISLCVSFPCFGLGSVCGYLELLGLWSGYLSGYEVI